MVTCVHCQARTPHLYHWYDGCTCAAGGAREEHSDHCALHGVELVHDDRLLSAGLWQAAPQDFEAI